MGGGGGGIKTEGGCRWVLPGVRTCSLFEEGLVDRGLGCPPVGLGVKRAGSKNCETWGACSASTYQGGGGVYPPPAQALSP